MKITTSPYSKYPFRIIHNHWIKQVTSWYNEFVADGDVERAGTTVYFEFYEDAARWVFLYEGTVASPFRK